MNNVPVILIGGIPGVGKTSISGHIARELKINIVMSGDYIRESIRAILPNDNILKFSVYDSWKPFGDETRENIIKGFREQGKIVNKATDQVMRRAIKDGEPMIIETLYFLPDQFPEIIKEILPLYIYIDSEKVHRERLDQRQNFTHFGSPGQRLSSNLHRYKIMMEESLKLCDSFEIPKFNNLNYEDTREQVTNFVKQRVNVRW